MMKYKILTKNAIFLKEIHTSRNKVLKPQLTKYSNKRNH